MQTSCPVCRSQQVARFLHRETVPVHQNLLFASAEDARRLTAGQLSMAVCEDCSFVFNQRFDPTLLSYGSHYDNSQNFSPSFEAHVDELVTRLVHEKRVHDCTIVEVGCGKGEFLRKLTANDNFRNRGHGFDPAYVGPNVDVNGRVEFHRNFYNAECARIHADVVVSRHVIEHISDPRGLLANIRAALKGSPDARVFFETPCVEWILKHQVAWDFFYEHCSLFTASALARVFEESGFQVRSVDHVFGGQYLWLEAVLSDHQPRSEPSLFESIPELPALARAYGRTESTRNAAWLRTLQASRGRGPLALWGAGAKGVTFANLIDSKAELFSCVVDVNPAKQGRFLAGTGHSIIAPGALNQQGIRSVLVLNPNYSSEIRDTVFEIDSSMTVIDLMNERAVAA